MDSYQTMDKVFACALMYLFGPESLSTIHIDGEGKERRVVYTLLCPSCDAEIYRQSFDSPEGLGISDLKSYWKIFARVSKTVGELFRRDEILWTNRANHGRT